jgi:putative lipoprotein
MKNYKMSLWGLSCRLLFFACLGFTVCQSCTEEKESLATPSNISFSHDTVRFDSVFSAEVSPTQLLRIYNKSSLPVRLERITLQGGEKSPFSLLVDGAATYEKTNLRIDAHDSLTLVIRLRPPQQGGNSFLLSDEIEVAITNQAKKHLSLEAWGLPHKDIHGSTIDQDTEWSNASALIITKPVVVAKGATLRILPGTSLYFRPNASLTVHGKLLVEGTIERRVLFAGTRLDSAYKYTPGQWQGLLLMPESGPHIIRNATFRSAVTAIRTDSPTASTTLENVIISGCSRDAIALRNTKLQLSGCILAQNSGSAISLRGAQVSMDFCTLTGDTRFGQARRASLILLDTPPEGSENMLSVVNSIIWGAYSDEVRATGSATLDAVNASHSIFKWTKNRPAPSERWEKIIYDDPLLEKPAQLNVELKSTSPARGTGLVVKPDAETLYDLKGRKRLGQDGKVDRGALVFRVEEENLRD